MKCVVWSVALYGAETLTPRWNEQKRQKALEMWIWRRMERIEWTDKIKKAVMLERVGEGRIISLVFGLQSDVSTSNFTGTDKEEEKKLTGPLAEKNLPA